MTTRQRSRMLGARRGKRSVLPSDLLANASRLPHGKMASSFRARNSNRANASSTGFIYTSTTTPTATPTCTPATALRKRCPPSCSNTGPAACSPTLVHSVLHLVSTSARYCRLAFLSGLAFLASILAFSGLFYALSLSFAATSLTYDSFLSLLGNTNHIDWLALLISLLGARTISPPIRPPGKKRPPARRGRDSHLLKRRGRPRAKPPFYTLIRKWGLAVRPILTWLYRVAFACFSGAATICALYLLFARLAPAFTMWFSSLSALCSFSIALLLNLHYILCWRLNRPAAGCFTIALVFSSLLFIHVAPVLSLSILSSASIWALILAASFFYHLAQPSSPVPCRLVVSCIYTTVAELLLSAVIICSAVANLFHNILRFFFAVAFDYSSRLLVAVRLILLGLYRAAFVFFSGATTTCALYLLFARLAPALTTWYSSLSALPSYSIALLLNLHYILCWKLNRPAGGCLAIALAFSSLLFIHVAPVLSLSILSPVYNWAFILAASSFYHLVQPSSPVLHCPVVSCIYTSVTELLLSAVIICSAAANLFFSTLRLILAVAVGYSPRLLFALPVAGPSRLIILAFFFFFFGLSPAGAVPSTGHYYPIPGPNKINSCYISTGLTILATLPLFIDSLENCINLYGRLSKESQRSLSTRYSVINTVLPAVRAMVEYSSLARPKPVNSATVPAEIYDRLRSKTFINAVFSTSSRVPGFKWNGMQCAEEFVQGVLQSAHELESIAGTKLNVRTPAGGSLVAERYAVRGIIFKLGACGCADMARPNSYAYNGLSRDRHSLNFSITEETLMWWAHSHPLEWADVGDLTLVLGAAGSLSRAPAQAPSEAEMCSTCKKRRLYAEQSSLTGGSLALLVSAGRGAKSDGVQGANWNNPDRTRVPVPLRLDARTGTFSAPEYELTSFASHQDNHWTATVLLDAPTSSAGVAQLIDDTNSSGSLALLNAANFDTAATSAAAFIYRRPAPRAGSSSTQPADAQPLPRRVLTNGVSRSVAHLVSESGAIRIPQDLPQAEASVLRKRCEAYAARRRAGRAASDAVLKVRDLLRSKIGFRESMLPSSSSVRGRLPAAATGERSPLPHRLSGLGAQSAPPAPGTRSLNLSDVLAAVRDVNAASDFYTLLGVERDSPADTIKAAFRAKCKLVHPDKVSTAAQRAVTRVDSAAAESAFKRLNSAMQTLLDPNLRSEYDSKLSASATPSRKTMSKPPAQRTRQSSVWGAKSRHRPSPGSPKAQGPPRQSAASVPRPPPPSSSRSANQPASGLRPSQTASSQRPSQTTPSLRPRQPAPSQSPNAPYKLRSSAPGGKERRVVWSVSGSGSPSSTPPSASQADSGSGAGSDGASSSSSPLSAPQPGGDAGLNPGGSSSSSSSPASQPNSGPGLGSKGTSSSSSSASQTSSGTSGTPPASPRPSPGSRATQKRSALAPSSSTSSPEADPGCGVSTNANFCEYKRRPPKVSCPIPGCSFCVDRNCGQNLAELAKHLNFSTKRGNSLSHPQLTADQLSSCFLSICSTCSSSSKRDVYFSSKRCRSCIKRTAGGAQPARPPSTRRPRRSAANHDVSSPEQPANVESEPGNRPSSGHARSSGPFSAAASAAIINRLRPDSSDFDVDSTIIAWLEGEASHFSAKRRATFKPAGVPNHQLHSGHFFDNLRRMLELASQGLVAKASRLLAPSKVSPLSPEVREKLDGLHPRAYQDKGPDTYANKLRLS